MSLPVGSIILWNRPAADIPAGWQVCDGTNGTPYLLNYFVQGAANDGEVGASETGSHSHSRPANSSSDGSHTHPMSISIGGSSGAENNVNPNVNGVTVASNGHGHSGGSGTTGSAAAHSHPISGNTGATTTDPLYVKLYYIMRIV